MARRGRSLPRFNLGKPGHGFSSPPVSGGGGGGGAPEWLSILDFQNQYYFAGGTERAIEDILAGSGNSWAGTPVDMPYIGLDGWESDVDVETPAPSAQVIQAAGAFLSDFTTAIGVTLVFDFTITDPVGFFAWSAFTGNEIDFVLSAQNNNVYIYDYNGDSGIDISPSISTGAHKIAMTVGPSQFALSLDGGSVQTSSPGMPFGLLDGTRQFLLQRATIHSIKLAAPVSNSTLAILSS